MASVTVAKVLLVGSAGSSLSELGLATRLLAAGEKLLESGSLNVAVGSSGVVLVLVLVLDVVELIRVARLGLLEPTQSGESK